MCWDPDEEVEGEKDCLPLTDVNMVAQLLKAFFRELPEPLVPFRWAWRFCFLCRQLEIDLRSHFILVVFRSFDN